MPATDKFIKVGRGTATTLASPGYTTGVSTSINVGSTTNWTTATGVIFAIDEVELVNGSYVRKTGTYNVYQGTVNGGTQITNVSWIDGDGDRNYSASATTRVYILITSAHTNRLMDGILVSHDQDGTLKADSVDVTAVIKDDIITNAKLSEFKPSEVLADYIYSGGAVAQSAGLVGTFSNIVYYIGGIRYTKTSVANKTYTASKDTYVDIGIDGTVDYNEVTNGAASPALASSHIRVAKVVTSGAAITSVVQNSSDSLANQIYPTDPRGYNGWKVFTPTWTGSGSNPSLGNGTITGAYLKIGRTVHCRMLLTVGSTTTTGTGNYRFSLPVTALAPDNAVAWSIGTPLGNATINDAGTNYYPGIVRLVTATTVEVTIFTTLTGANPVYTQGTIIWQHNIPFTIANTDGAFMQFTYEAAA